MSGGRQTDCSLGGMDAKEEALGLLSKVWQKLQALPDADPVELGAFFVLLTFIGEYATAATFCVSGAS